MRTTTELRYLILALQREGNRVLAAGLRPLNLTPAQAEALTVLAGHAPLSLNGLGDLLICESGNSPSRIVDRLVGAGLVQRDIDPADRRHVLLSLTPEGKELAKRVAAVENDLETFLDELIAGQPTESALTLLRSMATHFPAGQALERRRITR